jgi:phenylalanyl-tRNA synthetase beta chain
MKISREWLQEFVDFSDLAVDDFAELVTTRVAEIEECYTVGAPVSDTLVGKVLEVKPVPEKDKLSLVSVFLGSETLTVICGAPNVRENALVCYVPPGGNIRKADASAEEEELVRVEVKSFGAVSSQGVLLSQSELGIGVAHEGIVLLDEVLPDISFTPGSRLDKYVDWKDLVIDIDNKSLTHRPDLWSHFGFAREISALLNRPLTLSLDMHADYGTERSSMYQDILLRGPRSEYSVHIEPVTKARRFAVQHISGLNNGSSPIWLQRRLFAVGAGTRNLLVDASNYVLHEVGQPNHAYDPACLSGTSLHVRMAKKGEHFTGLDEVERKLEESDVVIADTEHAVSLAGIIGGKGYSVRPETSEILIESANFDPVFVRQVCKRHQVRTDSSNRFEKNLSPFQVPLGILRYLDVLIRSGQTPSVPASWADTFPDPPEKVTVPFRPSYIRKRLGGVPETDTEIESILSALQFTVEDDSVEVPYFRATRDISIEEDLVEEVGRTIGYDRVPENPPLIQSTGSQRGLIAGAEVQLREFFSAAGFTEVYNDTFMDPEYFESLGYSLHDAVQVLNPVDQNARGVRVSLVPALIEVAKRNQKNFSCFSGFEVGRSYHVLPADDSGKGDPGEQIQERRLVSFFHTVPKKEDSGGTPCIDQGAGFYSMRTICERLSGLLGAGDLSLLPPEETSERTYAQDFQHSKFWMHPHRAARILVNEMTCGVLAEVRPSFYPSRSERMLVAEIDIEALIATNPESRAFTEIPRFPASYFEISLVLHKKELFSTVRESFVANLGSGLLQRIEPVAVYEGAPLADEEKSLSLRFIFGKSDGTISAEELDTLRQRVIEVLEASKYRLRS